MKKKAISQIPYITTEKAPTRRPKKKYDYIAVVFERNIANEAHLFVEIYENEKAKLKTPVYRYVYTKKDWCKFDTVKRTWHRTKIHNYINTGSSPSWEKHNETTFISSESIEKVKKFTSIKCHSEEKWWRYLEKLEDNIEHQKWRRNRERRQERLEERCNIVPDLPEGFGQWCEESLFKDNNFLYYKRKGRYATFTCSRCGKTYSCAIKKGESFEAQVERTVEVPQNGNGSECDKCGAIGVYKTAGRAKNVYRMRKQCYVGQRTERGFVIRYIEPEKIFRLGEKEEFIYREITRTFLEEGKKVITDYNLYNNWIGEDEWHDHNIGGMGVQIRLNAAEVFPETIEQLKGTFLQYTGIEEYMKTSKKIKFAKYMELYTKMPCLEMFSKMGLSEIVNGLLEGVGIFIYQNEVKPDKIFGINKDKVKVLVREHGELEILKVFQFEKILQQNWSYEQCKALVNLRPNWKQLQIALEHMTMKKLMNRIEKYAECSVNAFCGMALGKLRHTVITYLDYLSMRQKLGYDLDNAIIQYPKDLEDGHRKMTIEINKKQLDKRIEEVESKFPLIRKRYKELNKMYAYEYEEYIIRPAKSAEEIVIEGRMLHHCVGGDTYLQRHNDGESAILFLRKKDEPDKQYITLEIRENRISQWYGAYDKKPDKEKIDKWLDDWMKAIRTNNLVVDPKAIAV